VSYWLYGKLVGGRMKPSSPSPQIPPEVWAKLSSETRAAIDDFTARKHEAKEKAIEWLRAGWPYRMLHALTPIYILFRKAMLLLLEDMRMDRITLREYMAAEYVIRANRDEVLADIADEIARLIYPEVV